MLKPHRAVGDPGGVLRACLVLMVGLCLSACSSGSGGAALSQTGQHPSGWTSTHWSDYAKNPDSCATCHGSMTDSTAAGGISQVSCFTCHPNGPGHPTNWATLHGPQGADSAAADWAGMASCAKCHGTDFTGGIAKVSCLGCHTKAPHPDAPWAPTDATPAPAYSHSYNVNASNASACYQCHANGANFSGSLTPAASGTLPGCFNNTLCHGALN